MTPIGTATEQYNSRGSFCEHSCGHTAITTLGRSQFDQRFCEATIAGGLFVQPSLVVYKIAEILGNSRVSCLWFIISFLAGNVVSVVTLLTLTGIAIDRFLAVYLHLKYQDVISVYCVLKVFALFWVIALAPVAVRMVSTAKAYSVIVLFLLVSCFLLCFLSYFRLLKVTRRHQRQIRNLSHAAAAASNSTRDSFHGNHGNHGNSYDSQENANATKVRRTSITMLLIAGTFYISYLPILGFMVAISIYSYTSPIKAWANIAKTIVFAGSSVNPVLYCLRIKEIRRAMLASMCKILRRPVNPIILSPATNRRQVSLAQVSNTFRTNSGAMIDIDA
ncbi:predicted protein [Nematostella vectensis]|uniref:G-protein coupled receptors family 1 profile domain-containing protein n=1 Tax=Nematostella vectensis TaxID=45351 RepID=A7SBG6_NEMVE|nr:predicted protein [Nematostella vectensis]|eukprot:XP_001630980.1 predicted protein [Nematostella vectensis]